MSQSQPKDALVRNGDLLGEPAVRWIDAGARAYAEQLERQPRHELEAMPVTNPFPALRRGASVSSWMSADCGGGITNAEAAARLVAKEREQHRRFQERERRDPLVAAVVSRLSPAVREAFGEAGLKVVASEAVRLGEELPKGVDLAAIKAQMADPDAHLHYARARAAARAAERDQLHRKLLEANAAGRNRRAQRLQAKLDRAEASDKLDADTLLRNTAGWVLLEAETMDPRLAHEPATIPTRGEPRRQLVHAGSRDDWAEM